MANPLSPAPRKPAAQQQHPVLAHAQMWQHMNSMQPAEAQQAVQTTSYTLPILGKLSGDPNVTRKDIIKAAADAAGAGKIPPSQAVQFITGMPDEPEKLQPWLKSLYAANLTAAVHLKAATMPDQQPQGAPQ
jgi:hypothetical protein